MPHVTIYTDGGCMPNPGAGGWGVVLIADSGAIKELSGAELETTNNRMELTAAVEALRALEQPSDVTMYTDSQYLRKGITEWLPGWVRRGWISSTKQPVKNQDLWQALHAEVQRHNITWQWVRGHAGNHYNERVDQLATAARERLTGKPTALPPADFIPDHEIVLRVSAGKSGGWAARIAATDNSTPFKTFTGRESGASSSQLELVAALAALRHLPPGAAVRVYCPSDYLYNGMTNWISGWQKRGWITSEKKPVKHRELWEALIAETEQRPIQWTLEKGQPPDFARGLEKLAADAGRTP